VKPFQKSDLVPNIEMAIGRFTDLKNIVDQRDLLEDQLESRKLVDRAKGFLIDNFGLTESESFVFIQRTAMSGRERMSDVALRVIAGELRP
jgi:response regulator NasT